MLCFNCQKEELTDTIVSDSFFSENGQVFVESIPCKKCTECGEIFLDDSTIKRILDIRDYADTIKSKILVFDYSTALPENKTEKNKPDKENKAEKDEIKYISYDEIINKIDDMF